MNIKEVKELIELINSSDIAYLELEIDNAHIKLDKSLTRGADTTTVESKPIVSTEYKEEIIKNVKNKEESTTTVFEETVVVSGDFTLIKSPMVGTFYSSPSPDSSNFVKVGDDVKVGDALCIIEAMKLMNEIESEFNGKIMEILVKDGDMVEYGTPLFKLKEM